MSTLLRGACTKFAYPFGNGRGSWNWYTTVMKLFLVRHGETDANRILGHGVTGPIHSEPVTFKIGDDTNISLNIYGREQAEYAGGELSEKIDKMYASPLLRVKETAEIIARIKSVDFSTIEFRDELIEYRQGSFKIDSTELKKNHAVQNPNNLPVLCNYDYSPWGGDSWEAVYTRLSSFFEVLKKHNNNETVVCVTSGGVIRMAYKIFFWDKSPGITKHIMVKNGSVHEFVID
jgi:broad specificity phosphatase PhoE